LLVGIDPVDAFLDINFGYAALLPSAHDASMGSGSARIGALAYLSSALVRRGPGE
jgi:hypothetical protein